MKSLTEELVIACDVVIDMPEIVSINSNDKNAILKIDYVFPTILSGTTFIKVINNCYYLLLLHKTLVKIKGHIIILLILKCRVMMN